MSGRRSDSMDREDKYNRKRYKREDRDRKSSTLKESPIMSLNEIRDKAKNEQRVRGHRQTDRHSDEDTEDRHRRHRERYQNRPFDESFDRNSHRRDGRHSDDWNRHKSNEFKDRNRDSFKSEEFWSKESKDMTKTKDEKEVKPKEKPNLEITGKLAEDTNTFNGVVIKYNEPSEARKPKKKWRLYPFKGEDSLPFIPIHRQSAYMLGRDRKVADIPIDHPSCSKQHSVIQFRLIEYKREDQTIGKRLRPYIIDLESSNGTYVNNQRIDTKKYYEIFEKDVIKFGFSTREYVVLHEQSRDEDEDEDIEVETEVKEEVKEEIKVKDEPKDKD